MILSGFLMFMFISFYSWSCVVGLGSMALFALWADIFQEKLIDAKANEHYRIAGVPLEEKELSPMEEWDKEFDQWRSKYETTNC